MVRGVRVIQSQLISLGMQVRQIDNTPWGRPGIDSLEGKIAWGRKMHSFVHFDSVLQ